MIPRAYTDAGFITTQMKLKPISLQLSMRISSDIICIDMLFNLIQFSRCVVNNS